jgi:predicted nucleic acid-binding protein
VAVVVDASIIVALATSHPRCDAARRAIERWISADEAIHAPELLAYEVASALTLMVSQGHLPADRVDTAWRAVTALTLTYHPLGSDGGRAVEIALRLGRRSAYDAAYIALAERIEADLWALDGPLVRNAAGLGFPVRLLT